MEYNKEEARRSIDIAERRISEKDYVGAKKFVYKAHNLYPNLDGLNQLLMMIDVFISASNVGGGEPDWYGILGVDPLADDETVKRQYKKLALLLHPDKNKFVGAEGAFKLVSEAWSLLSDKDMRIAYDLKRMQKPPPNPSKPASSDVKARRKKPASADSSKGSGSFWTRCSRCSTQCEYLRGTYLNKTVICPNCRQPFTATEKSLQGNFVKPVVNISSSTTTQQPKQQKSSTNKNTNRASSWSTPSPSAATVTQKAPQESAKSQATSQNPSGGTYSGRTNSSPFGGFSYNLKWRCSMQVKTSSNGGNQAQERVKRWFQEPRGKVADAERMAKKPRTDTKNYSGTRLQEQVVLSSSMCNVLTSLKHFGLVSRLNLDGDIIIVNLEQGSSFSSMVGSENCTIGDYEKGMIHFLERLIKSAKRDFVDVLCGILSLPLRDIARLLEKHQNLQSFGCRLFMQVFQSLMLMIIRLKLV